MNGCKGKIGNNEKKDCFRAKNGYYLCPVFGKKAYFWPKYLLAQQKIQDRKLETQ